jgi:hypothetical protein
MGAWGYGIYDNDTAADLVADFEETLKSGKEIYMVFNKLKYKNSWYVTENWGVLAFADLQLKHNVVIDSDIYQKAMNAIEEELESIQDWREPQERRDVILQFKEKLQSAKTNITD